MTTTTIMRAALWQLCAFQAGVLGNAAGACGAFSDAAAAAMGGLDDAEHFALQGPAAEINYRLCLGCAVGGWQEETGIGERAAKTGVQQGGGGRRRGSRHTNVHSPSPLLLFPCLHVTAAGSPACC